MWILIALDFAEMVTGCSWIMHIRLNKNGGQRSPGLHRHNVNAVNFVSAWRWTTLTHSKNICTVETRCQRSLGPALTRCLHYLGQQWPVRDCKHWGSLMRVKINNSAKNLWIYVSFTFLPNISNIHIFKRVYKNVEFLILIYYIILVCMLTRIFRALLSNIFAKSIKESGVFFLRKSG